MIYLTKQQKGIYDFLKEYIQEYGYAPSIQEICDHFGTTSLSTMHKQLVTLENKGFIKRTPNMKRAIELVDRESSEMDPFEVPVMGIVTEGSPIETSRMVEYLKLPDKVTKGRRVYMLEVKGDFFIDEFIRDGDYVAIESTNKIKKGQIALVRLAKDNVTLRRITKSKGKVILDPLNSEMKQITVDEEDIKILGILIAVFRDFLE